MGVNRTQLKSTQKRETAIRLRLEGLSYSEIGREMGTSKVAAWKLINRAYADLREKLLEDTAVTLQIELARLDQMHRAIWDDALAGNLNAVDRLLRIMERRARLLGLDAPEKHELAHQGAIPTRIEIVSVEPGHNDIPNQSLPPAPGDLN